MKNKTFNLDKELKEKSEKSKKEIIENFTALEKATKDIDPIFLLSLLALPTGNTSGVKKIYLERKLEFLSGFLVTHPYDENKEELIDRELIDKVNKVVNILDNYFDAINSYNLFVREKKADTYFLCNRLCKDIKGDKRTGYSSQLDRAKIYG